MTVLTRFEPFRELAVLQDRMNRLFSDQFNTYSAGDSLTAGSFVPPVDVYEDEHGIELKMEVPGIEEKDIDIRLENNVLTISRPAPIVEGRKGRELPSHRAPLWQLLAQLYPAELGGHREGLGQLREGRAEGRSCKRAEAKPKQIKVEVAKEMSATAK